MEEHVQLKEITALQARIKTQFPENQAALVLDALALAEQAHAGQKRMSGEPYIIHPVHVADILMDMHMDYESIAVGLLHDVIEDCGLTQEDLIARFGTNVATLVESLTKLGKLKFVSREERNAETLRKMLLAMAQDMRVVIIKLADRMHNMMTLEYQDPIRQKQIAQETLDIYAPLAHRLGMFRISSELEDLCFKFLHPADYESLKDALEKMLAEREPWMAAVRTELYNHTVSLGISPFEINSRTKHLYSIYRKMKKNNRTLDQIYDVFAFRVIVPEIKDCYAVLGEVHTIWKPIPGRFKDYISVSKANQYQSLHTTVIGRYGIPFEVQIRTFEMHQMAEYGIAAHWMYKEGVTSPNSVDKRLNWFRRFMEDQSDLQDAQDFLDVLKTNLFLDEVFVFTPKGDVINLPVGATPVDFAYSIHSAIGNRCVGAKANGRIIPLDQPLKSGEIIEIITSNTSRGPSRDWLHFVRTSEAKSKIRAWFKREDKEENIIKGRDMLEGAARRLGYTLPELLKEEYLQPMFKRYSMSSINDLYATVGCGGLTTNQVLMRLIEAYKRDMGTEAPPLAPAAGSLTPVHAPPQGGHSSQGVRVKGEENMLVRFSNCCNPVPGDDIIGYITRGRGVSVHRADCPNMHAPNIEPDRLVEVSWDNAAAPVSFKAEIHIVSQDRARILADISIAMSDMGVPILGVNAHMAQNGLAIINLVCEISDTQQLAQIVNRLKRISGVQQVHRTGKQS
nr:bifunctional (p)ppGpp synthetase/guanosine-3',5'-bis(diphosphate) 3'-pyrophosphohydrolase [bacterium]